MRTALFLVLVFVAALATFLLRGRLFPLPPKQASIEDEMRERAEIARQRAQSEFNVTLDDSPDSIKRVEEILEQIHQKWKKAGPVGERERAREFVLWAAYIGAVVKKERPDAKWQQDSELGPDTFPLVLGERNFIFPIAWVWKRIENGEEDNVWTKYELTLHRDRYQELRLDGPSKD